VPCNQGSEFRVFENIFVDIGDNQSIESDLSTYSSHLKAAKHIINFCDANTLVLMDEIGTGTDPMFGGPMAEAVLEEINKKEAFGIITTHFSNIKAKAKKLNGVENAAMLFDIENLVPLYKLQVGQPGSSFVYEVASNIGLNKRLIKRAKQLTNTKQYDLDSLLAEVQSQKEELNAKLTLAREREAKAELFESEYLSLKQSIERQKAEIIAQAKEKANGIIKSANKEIENTIREIKENKADKAKTKVVRDKLASKLENKPIDLQQVEVQEFKIGDKVLVKNSETVGEVVEIKKNKVTLQIGSITTKTNLANLEKVGKKTEKAVKRYISNSSYSERQLSFSSEKDVRGMRTVDALSEIDSWIDSAIILGIGQLTLLHGKGSGILKQEVRRHLKPNKAVKSITYAHVELGGEGVSIIELN
jgi:DNA mismatch repair protein MutS2